MMKHIDIFWTGGYDSTFRVCQLSRNNVVIQPYYLADKRQSEEKELDAIRIITNKLRENEQTRAVINDLIYIPADERPSDERISKAFVSLFKKDFMGSQYEWLGAFALDHKGIEMSIHRDDKAINLISKHGSLILETDEVGEYYVIDRAHSEDNCITLFGNLHFPLANYTKLQMKDEYEEMGLSDIIDDTWFCARPINGKPCGCCNPCMYSIEEGMGYRFSYDALRRYRRRSNMFFKALYKLKIMVKRVIR